MRCSLYWVSLSFFWFSFHQNGMSLSFFARDFVDSSAVAPEVWQAINPFFVIALTPVIMAIFGGLAKRGKEISTPRKIAIGMFIAGTAFLFLAVFFSDKGLSLRKRLQIITHCRTNGKQSSLVGFDCNLFLPDGC